MHLAAKLFAIIFALLAGATSSMDVLAAEDREPRDIRFDQLYAGAGSPTPEFSALAKSLAGKRVRVTGYAAAPFRAEAEFMMLTRSSMHVCPYCNSDNNWPIDIIVAYTKGISPTPNPATPINVIGTLELGPKLDPVTGMVSSVRLSDSSIEIPRK